MSAIIISALIVLYLRWIIIILFFPCQWFNTLGRKCDQRLFEWILRFPYRVLHRISKGGFSRYVVYEVGLIPSFVIRKMYYKAMGVEMGERVVFHFRTELRDGYGIKIGDGTIVGDNAILDGRNGLIIGRNVNISSNVSIYTEQHNHRRPNFDCVFSRPMAVTIGDRAWLGSNVIVLPGVSVGEGAVVCAGAVVTKDVEPYAVVAGIPAQKVSERPRNISYELSGETGWFY